MYIYQTTIAVPNEPVRYYVGSRSRNPDTDIDYFGSGNGIKAHKERFGTKYLSKWIIKDSFEDKKQLCSDEIWYIQYFMDMYGDRCLNEKLQGNSAGWVMSAEGRKNISNSKKGEKAPWYGKKFSEEHRRKIGDATRGEKNPSYGKPKSDITKAKISKARTRPNAVHRVYPRIPASELPLGNRGTISLRTFTRILKNPDDKRYTECMRLFEKYKV